MQKHIEQRIHKFKQLFHKKSNPYFVSSFELTVNQTPSVIRDIFLQHIHKIHLSDIYIENLISSYYKTQSDSNREDDSEYLKILKKHCHHFYDSVFEINHSSQCESFLKFQEKYASSNHELSNWKQMLNSVLASLNINHQELDDFRNSAIEDLNFAGILKNINQIKNKKTQKMEILKRFSCYLRFVKKWKFKRIVECLPLTKFQAIDASRKFLSRKYETPFEEKRGKHMKQQTILDEIMLNWIEERIKNGDHRLTAMDIKNKFRISFPSINLSLATIYRSIKSKLGFQFGKVGGNPKMKNEIENKKYRFWFSHFFMNEIVNDRLIISIDESSLSFYKTNFRAWYHPVNYTPSDNCLTSNSTNLSILVAVSQRQLIGFYVAEGSIDSIMYADFLMNLDKTIKMKFQHEKAVTIIMDNAKIHKNILIRSLIREKDLKVVFTPSYSPEIHFIEFLFERVKRKFKKRCEKTNK